MQENNKFIKELAEKTNSKFLHEGLSSDVKHRYSFDCLPVDLVFGGGLPSGRLIEIHGWESVGKSTFALEMAKAFAGHWKNEKDNGIVAWIESETAFDKVRAAHIGIDLSNFLIREVSVLEEGFKFINGLMDQLDKKGNTTKLLIVWDTIAAVSTEKEYSEGVWSGGMIEKPKVLKRGLKELMERVGKNDATLVLVNQVYTGVGGYKPATIAPGGSGIKFHASIRVKMDRSTQFSTKRSDGSEVSDGALTKITSIKNKVTIPNQTAYIYIHPVNGFDAQRSLYEHCCKMDMFKSSGSWKVYEVKDKFSCKFQNFHTFKEQLGKIPEMLTYLEYDLCKLSMENHNLLKFYLIDKVWELEESIYGNKVTKFSSEEEEMLKSLKVKKNEK